MFMGPFWPLLSFFLKLHRKKDRCRTCRKMFLVPDVLPSRKHTSIARDVGRLHAYATPVSFNPMCFRIATPSLSISAQSVRKHLPLARKILIFPYRQSPYITL